MVSSPYVLGTDSNEFQAGGSITPRFVSDLLCVSRRLISVQAWRSDHALLHGRFKSTVGKNEPVLNPLAPVMLKGPAAFSPIETSSNLRRRLNSHSACNSRQAEALWTQSFDGVTSEYSGPLNAKRVYIKYKPANSSVQLYNIKCFV